MKYTEEDYQNQLPPPEEEIQVLAEIFERPISLAEGMLRRVGVDSSKESFITLFWTLKWLEKHKKFFDLGSYGIQPNLYVVNLNYQEPNDTTTNSTTEVAI